MPEIVVTNWFRKRRGNGRQKWHAGRYASTATVYDNGPLNPRDVEIFHAYCGVTGYGGGADIGDGIEPPEDEYGVCKRCMVYLETAKREAEATK